MFPGNFILHSEVAVEKLGGWQSVCVADGLEFGHHFRGGEETKEKAFNRLSLFKSQASQFLVLQILLL